MDQLDGIWRENRRNRAKLVPVFDREPARRATYTTALEQAEQMFRAAQSIGLETKPILLYYGLFQATRAISAATEFVQPNWRLFLHGLKCNADERERGEIAPSDNPFIETRVEMMSGRNKVYPSGFSAICQLKGSDTLSGPISLGELIALTQNDGGGRAHPFPGTEDLPRTVSLDGHRPSGFARSFAASLTGLPAAVLKSPASEIESFLRKHYPMFRSKHDWSVVESEVYPSDGYCIVSWRGMPMEVGHVEFRRSQALNYARSITGLDMQVANWQTFPEFNALGEKGLNPLCAWWGILCALSMLARYAPSTWATDIDVDRTSYAVDVAQLVEDAGRQVSLKIGSLLADITKTN